MMIPAIYCAGFQRYLEANDTFALALQNGGRIYNGQSARGFSEVLGLGHPLLEYFHGEAHH